MKKFVLLAALLILTLGAFTLPATAQEQDLTTMAQYLPADAPVYFAFRTDDDLIVSLDDLLTRFGEIIPTSLSEALDDLVAAISPGSTFTTLRSWLGDQAAIGIYDLQGQSAGRSVPPITIALAITDQDAAQAFFEKLDSSHRYTSEASGDATVYTPDGSFSSDPYYIFRDDVVLVTGDAALAESGGVLAGESLSDNPAFGTSLELLPADQYTGIFYMDTPAIMSMALEDARTNRMNDSEEAAFGMFASLLSAVEPQAIGLTLLDDRTLALDYALPVNADATEPFNFGMSGTPIDPAFAERIPAGTPFIVQGTDLYANYQNSLDNLRTLVEMMPPNDDFNPEDVATALFALNFAIRGLTGMEPGEALGWMNGDYAVSLGFSPAFLDSTDVVSAMTGNPFEFGITIEAADEAAAQAFFDGLTRSLSALSTEEVTVTEDTLPGGTPSLNFSITTRNSPFVIDLVAAFGNGVFSFGTPHTVAAAVEPQANGGMSTDPSYIEATGYILEGSNWLTFLSSSNLVPVANLMTAAANSPSVREQGKQFRLALTLFSSLSLTTSALPDGGGSLVRVVWTLPE